MWPASLKQYSVKSLHMHTEGTHGSEKLCTYYTSIAVMLCGCTYLTDCFPVLAALSLPSAALAATILAEGQAYHSITYNCNARPQKADIFREENIEHVD